jgi:DNA phosphorothioation-dependent restriction protein DptH
MNPKPTINTYYQKIISLILDQHQDEFASADSGHCMKITGLGSNELEYLWDQISKTHKSIETYIVSDTDDSYRHISATRLIELRNKQEKPLLVLIPFNSRTAAEDSYGNATFKEISLAGVESDLESKLLSEVPADWKDKISDIRQYLKTENITQSNVIQYLLALGESGYTNKNIGNFLYQLHLLPDEDLLLDEEATRSRLNFNLLSIRLLNSFNKPVYDRIEELPLETNTLQKDLVSFFKIEKEAKSAKEICEKIYCKYPNLNFRYWQIPDLDIKNLKLTVEDIQSKDFRVEEGKKVLRANPSKSSKIKVKFSTQPAPKDRADLKFFRIVLMAVSAGGGEVIRDLRKLKNTNSNRSYREATVELNPNMTEEISYFLKVQAEDEHGNILNNNDDFKDAKIQKAWEGAKQADQDTPKSSFDYKLTCDSEDFDYVLEDVGPPPPSQRKDKLRNVLQAFFKFRSDQLKAGNEAVIPEASENSNIWLGDNTKRLISTFHINYSANHNYQISLSAKLRLIEEEFLKNASEFGFVTGILNIDAGSPGFDGKPRFIGSELTSHIPTSILKLRESIFNRIRCSNEQKNGVFETADVFNFADDVREYLSLYNEWISELRLQISSKELEPKEQANLQRLLTQVQILDTAKVKTRLPDGKSVEALLVCPLHPLRLAWFVQLVDLFEVWEKRTWEFPGYKESWKHLEDLFLGQLSPENNPLVLVEPGSYVSYSYSGELCYGWGLYLKVPNERAERSLTSVNRQLKHFFRVQFNISKENYVESDISLNLIVRHIRNYILQHPYTDKLIINLFNAGDASLFADGLVELEKDRALKKIKYEIRVFKGDERIIEHGDSIKNLINPEFNITEEAEAFSQPSKNRLFPKLRFSINNINDYLNSPSNYIAHVSFLVSPYPLQVELVKPRAASQSFYLNGLLTKANLVFEELAGEYKWKRFIKPNDLPVKYSKMGEIGVSIFHNLQTFIAGALASKFTESLPATQLTLTEHDKVLLTHFHDYSDWVITFDKNLGPQIFDQPSKDGRIPFLLDYVPGEETSGISSYLTTRATSEVLGLLGPHFEEFNLDVHNAEDERKIKMLLEDLRAISSSLVLQLNSSRNKAFEVIGAAFTKRVLEKKGFLKESFLIPIDLHQNLFEDLPTDSKSRADNLLVSFDSKKREIIVTVIEIKCRRSLGKAEKEELKEKMKSQIENTIKALQTHFDPEHPTSFDRLDREIKNKELRSLLGFYVERANRYEYLSGGVFAAYSSFLETLDDGFRFKFNQLGLIFDFAASKRHEKEVVNDELTFFIFGGKLIEDIIDPDSELNTNRLEEKEFDEEFRLAFGLQESLLPLINKYRTDSETNASSGTVDKDTPTRESRKTDVANENLGAENQPDDEVEAPEATEPDKTTTLDYDILIGKESSTSQYGVLGTSIHGKKIVIDLEGTNTMSLFGIQGGGKSYTIGTVSEMVLKQIQNVNKLNTPLASVIFHYSESMEYAPEFTSMIYPNDKDGEIEKLQAEYGANPECIDDVIILTPKDKVEERRSEYPSIEVLPIAFNSKEIGVKDWMFLLGAIGNDSTYIKQLKAIMKELRRSITLNSIAESVEASELLSNAQKALARQRLSFAREYIDDSSLLQDSLKPGRLVIVDLRDEFIVKDEALGLFVIMLNIFSGVKNYEGKHFNKFIVFDEAHKYMDNKDLTGNIVTAIREMRHKGVSIMIASQDPPSLPNEIIELSSIVLMHRFNSPQWLKHIQRSITQLSTLTPADMGALTPGEGFLWATKATDKSISTKPVKISTRPRVTKHGGETVQATGNN